MTYIHGRLASGLLAAVLALGTTPLAAAQGDAGAQGQPQEGQQQTQAVEGELQNVDATNQMLTVRTADGNTAEFKYNEQTQVIGGAEDVAGLAGMSATQVVVEFTTEGGEMTATLVQIRDDAQTGGADQPQEPGAGEQRPDAGQEQP